MTYRNILGYLKVPKSFAWDTLDTQVWGRGDDNGSEADRRRTAKSFVFKIKPSNRFVSKIIAF
jgi:hypothetical protein